MFLSTTLQILHYWVKDFFGQTTVVAHQNALKQVQLHVTRDTLGKPENLKVTLQVYHWSNLTVQNQKIWNIRMVSTLIIIQGRIQNFCTSDISKFN